MDGTGTIRPVPDNVTKETHIADEEYRDEAAVQGSFQYPAMYPTTKVAAKHTTMARAGKVSPMLTLRRRVVPRYFMRAVIYNAPKGTVSSHWKYFPSDLFEAEAWFGEKSGRDNT